MIRAQAAAGRVQAYLLVYLATPPSRHPANYPLGSPTSDLLYVGMPK